MKKSGKKLSLHVDIKGLSQHGNSNILVNVETKTNLVGMCSNSDPFGVKNNETGPSPGGADDKPARKYS